MAQRESVRFASERSRVRLPPRPPVIFMTLYLRGGGGKMKDLLCDGFQETVDEYLVRHRSVLDVLTKLTESSSRINRAVAKAVTTCGCVRIEAEKQSIPPDANSLNELKEYMKTHLEGHLCDHCSEILEDEIGRNLFYLAALCNLFDLNLYDILLKEQERVSCLGIFNFS